MLFVAVGGSGDGWVSGWLLLLLVFFTSFLHFFVYLLHVESIGLTALMYPSTTVLSGSSGKYKNLNFGYTQDRCKPFFSSIFFFPVTTMNKSLLIFWQDYSCLWVIFSRQWTTVFWCKLAWICSRQTLSIFSNREFGWERQFREKENVSLQPIGYNKSHMALQILLATSKYIGHFYRE